jgi:hypothetical protein
MLENGLQNLVGAEESAACDAECRLALFFCALLMLLSVAVVLRFRVSSVAELATEQ